MTLHNSGQIDHIA